MEPSVLFVCEKDRDALLELVGLRAVAEFPKAERYATRFESHENYDYLVIHVPDFRHPEQEPALIECYLTKENLIVSGDCERTDALEAQLIKKEAWGHEVADFLFILFNQLLLEVMPTLDAIEDAIELLEEQVGDKVSVDRSQSIAPMRRELLVLNRYLRSLFDLFDAFDDNLNELLSRKQLRLLRAYKDKVSRLLNRTRDLRDYLSQLREAFQNELDISLNETMRFFTVITAVFLPPTLIVGWYGMNLRMPELLLPHTYPIVIGLSAVLIVVSLIYCKRKGWF